MWRHQILTYIAEILTSGVDPATTTAALDCRFHHREKCVSPNSVAAY